MLVDTTQLMYSTFQCCRHALRCTSTALPLLAETLEMIKQQGTFVVQIADNWVEVNALQRIVVTLEGESKGDSSLSTANEKLFSLIDIATYELQVLWASESKYAVKSLGYALHNIPALPWNPEKFSAKFFLFNFRIVGRHWNELSLELRQAFCEIQGIELAEATALMDSEDFTKDMWRTTSEN